MKRIYQISIDGQTHDVELHARTADSITFCVKGETHTVRISTPLVLQEKQNFSSPVPRAPRERELSVAAATPGSVIALMPGIVAKLLCTPGQDVERDTPLLIIEAMKMENTIAAPCAGKVARIAVAAGEEVKKGQLLVELTTG